jgi:uncharacterized protein (TIGR02996 family)
VSEAQLLSGIYEHPDDDARRLVYADWLLERGDERGELIHLQCAGGDPDRVQALLAKHGRRWLGKLALVLLPEGTVWERGFPVACRLRVTREADAENAAGDPGWTTIRSISLHGETGYGTRTLLQHPVLSSLRELHGLTCDGLHALPAPVASRLTCVTIDDGDMHAGALARLHAVEDLGLTIRTTGELQRLLSLQPIPQVRCLRLMAPAAVARLVNTAAGAIFQLNAEEVIVSGSRERPPFETVGWHFHLRRDLTLAIRWRSTKIIYQPLRLLEDILPDLANIFVSVRVDPEMLSGADDEQRGRLDRAAAHLAWQPG